MILRKMLYLLPSRRRAAEREMREELESLASLAGPDGIGSLALVSEAARQTWHWTAFDGFWADLRYALRMIANQPGPTAIAALSLGLGIGAGTGVFSFADGILLRPLPVAQPSRLLAISAAAPDAPAEGLSYPELRDLRAGAASFSGLAAYRPENLGVAVRTGVPPQSRMVLLVNPGFFDVLGVAPLYGALILPEREPAAVLAYDFWKSEYASDPSVIGRSIRLNGIDFQISGIAPESFTGMDLLFRPVLYAPLGMRARLTGTALDPLEDRTSRDLAVKGRLARGASAGAARAEVARVGAALAKAYPRDNRRQFIARSEQAFRLRQYPFRAVVLASMAALALMVLLIACANVANLMLARTRARSREMAIRLAIGAGRLRLIRQLLIESLALSVLAGLAGLILATGIMRFLGGVQVSSDVPIALDLPLDARLLCFNASIAFLSCLLFGLSPALHAARTDLTSALRSREGDGGVRRFLSGRGFSVAAQVALALILLTVAGSYLAVSRTAILSTRGFRTDHRISMELDPVAAHYNTARAQDLYRRLREHALSIPGVRSVALCESLPYSPNQSSLAVTPEGYSFPPGREHDVIFGGVVDENYFATIGIPIVQGRPFQAADRADTRRVAIVNQEFARTYWPGRDPIGRRVRVDGAGAAWEVVGVAQNARYLAPSEPQRPYLYLPFEQRPRPRLTLIAETVGDPANFAGPLRQTVRSLDPDLPVLNLRTLAVHETRTLQNWFIFVDILIGLGVAGLVLALGGVYGLVSYGVSRRTAEFGIRVALGATPASVVRMVVRQGLKPAAAGTCIGGVVSFLLGPRLAVGVQTGPGQHLTNLAVAVLLLAACAAASYLPARRAARLSPSAALRED